ncbi:IS5 family transposase, partial [Saccharothrix sp. MB29]|nr:IS5 family transposase [Saccharothrix sp. MB29]
LRDDLLATVARLERGRRVVPAARGSARGVALGRAPGLGPRRDRHLARPGRSTWPKSGPSPVDRARPGSKHHVLTDGGGIPLAVLLTGGNRNDVIGLEPLLDGVPNVRGRRGRPRRRPKTVYADRGYDHDNYRRRLCARGIMPRIARRGEPHGSGLGTVRWVVERTIAWYHGMKRLRIRWERRDDIHEAFLGLATCIICYRHVRQFC